MSSNTKIISNYWDREALTGKKEEIRGRYLSGLFLRAVDRGIAQLAKTEKINLLKTDLWNEGADFEKNVLGHYANDSFNLYGVDISREVINAVKIKGILKTQADITNLPFRDNSFDIIVDLSTLDHVPLVKSQDVLSEYKRTLKSEGVLVIAIDAWGLIWKVYFTYLEKVRRREIGVFHSSRVVNQYIYKPSDILEKLTSLGFKILKEYSIDWFGWSWNRITAQFWKTFLESGYQRLIDLEYSNVSKYMKPFAKQYVIIARVNDSKIRYCTIISEDKSLLENRLIDAWRKHHSSNIFLSRTKDKLGLDIVGVRGLPLEYNKFLHHFNLISVKNLSDRVGSLTGKYVLDVGCGTGRWSRYMSDRGAKVTGIDISNELLNNNKITMPEIEFVNMSACKMKFEDGKFDLVISVTVLQHMPYGIQEEAIQEICRVLKVGGYALIIEGTREDEDKIYKHSFPHSTRGWIKKFQDGNCVLMYHLKNTNPFLINLYFKFRDKILCLFKNKIDGISSETADALDTSSYDKIMNDKIKGEGYKKLLFLRKVFRICNYFIICLLSKISYPIEYLNMYIFRYYPTSDGAFLFKKAGK